LQTHVHSGEGELMKGNEGVIAILNECLKGELTAINQYFLHAEMCENWGYMKLASYGRKESIDEMKHAEALMERILYLDGMPTMSELFPLRIGRTVKEQLENDLALELDAIPRLNRGIELCVQVGDNGSRELLVKILTDEEHHVDFLEAQLHIIQEIGFDNYLAQQIHGDDH
jgi:bacterioferritin